MLSPQRNYLSAFKKMISLPADLVTSAATTIASPFQRSRDEPSTPSASKNSDTHTTTTTSSPTTPTSKRSSMLKTSSPSSPVDIRDTEFNAALHELDTMQDLLSLETVLQLIHVNKDAERRVEKFLQIGFPEVMHAKV